MINTTRQKAIKSIISFIFAFTILGSVSAKADNFCSYGHGSGGGGLVELADGSLAIPKTLKSIYNSKANSNNKSDSLQTGYLRIKKPNTEAAN